MVRRLAALMPTVSPRSLQSGACRRGPALSTLRSPGVAHMHVNLRSKSHPKKASVDPLYKTTQSTHPRSILLVPDVLPSIDYIDLISVFPVQQVLETLYWWRKKEILGTDGSQRATLGSDISKNLESSRKAQFFLRPLCIRTTVAGSRSACHIVTSPLCSQLSFTLI